MLARIAPVVAVLLGIGVGAWLLWPRDRTPPPPPASAPAVPAAPASTAPLHPVEAPAEPLPALAQSDPALVEAIARLLGSEALRRFFEPEEIARRFVATVDNLPRESYATRLNPVKPIAGGFAVSGSGDALVIAPANAARYAAFVRLAESVDAGSAVALYKRFYPLFQQAYVELGYPNGYFNDRLVAVIDHLLATPEVRGPIRLTVPHVLYEFADPDLQERSAGQRALLRVGPENAARLKAKLTEVRAALVAPSR